MPIGKNEYVIHIRTNAKRGNTPVTNPATDTSTDEGGETKGYWAKSAESAKSAAQKIVSGATAIAVADKLISYEVNSVSLRTGATEYERKLQFGYSTFKQTVLPLAIGAATGGLPGAVIGGLFSLAMQGISWTQNAQTIRYNQNLEDISIGMANIRAGVTGSRSNRQ